MSPDTPDSVVMVPIERIEVLNSRDRNMKVFEEIVENIRSIGLKKPITVTERARPPHHRRHAGQCVDGGPR
jgi:ParB family chromosome partitioning protein